MRLAHKTDANQRLIVAALRKADCLVLPLSAVGKGVPDLLVYSPYKGLVLMEIKTEGGNVLKKLTKAQKKFMARGWPVSIVTNIYEALSEAGIRVG